MKNTYTIQSGRPSWHQARAGHAFSGSITLEQTPDEHAAFLAKLKERNEPFHVTKHDGTPYLPPGPLEAIAARYESQGSTLTAAKIREAAAHNGVVLVYRALWSFTGGFTTEAIPLCGEDPRDAWDEILKSDCNAYDRPRKYIGMIGPCAL